MNDEILHSDVWLHVFSYISVLDACNSLQFVSKRFFYLSTLLQELAAGPQLAAAPTAPKCLEKLTRKPALVLSFQQDGTGGVQSVPACVPDGAVLLGATASDVQSNMNGAVTTGPSVVMLGFGPDTVVMPFFNELPDDSEDYDVMIVYACGHGYHYAEPFVSAFQAKCPDATIVGGMCEGGFVSDDNNTLDAHGIRQVTSGIFGVLGKNMPLRSVVSRGVKSLTDNVPWRVQEAKLVYHEDEEYIFIGNDYPYHCITKICKDTVPPTSPTALLSTLSPDFCGLQRNDGNGFELHVLNPISIQTDSIILMTDGSGEQTKSLVNAQLDLFSLDGDECKRHMDWTLQQLKEQTRDETILGAVMFSCNGRGPRARSLLREAMSDATRFHKHFENIPCCGFYAGGEIGPMALAGSHHHVFQRGKVAVQGFTAVFALFIVPATQPRAFDLDDSDENVANFVRDRLEPIVVDGNEVDGNEEE
jgi:hypothetical protein